MRIIEQVAKALHAAHKAGLVHRDVKPSNILLDEDDYAYLIDFGIARAAGETGLTATGGIIGSLHYMAPERFSCNEADARVDVYALTCVLYECLTGRPPYPGDSPEQQFAGHLSAPPPRPSRANPNLPAEFDRVTAKGLAKNPDQRYATTVELAHAARHASTSPIPRSAPIALPTNQPVAPPYRPGSAMPAPRQAPSPAWQPFSPQAEWHQRPPDRQPASAPPGNPPRASVRRRMAIDNWSGQPVSGGRRFQAAIIDVIPIPIIYYGMGFGLTAVIPRETVCTDVGYSFCYQEPSTAWIIVAVILPIVSVVAYCLWNWGHRQGKTGATIGNSMLKYKVVSAATGQPLGLSGKRIAKIIGAALAGIVLVYLAAAIVVMRL